MAKDPYSIEELLRLVKSSGENSNVDAKAPMGWDEGDESARLAKDRAAFANSRDGGAIVIGKSENNGQFEYVGVSAEQAATFDTTRVANWSNSRFNPPINPNPSATKLNIPSPKPAAVANRSALDVETRHT